MIGAKDLAFPRLNLLSWYLYIAGGLLALWAVVHGGVDTGWTFYTPYSTVYSNGWVIVTAVGIFITGLLVDPDRPQLHRHHPHDARPGHDLVPAAALLLGACTPRRLIQILGTPVLAITLLLVAAERLLHLGIFDPALGGDPVLFQHLFWFYSHPAVYIMILPAMGVISEIIDGLRAQADLRLQVHRVLVDRDRGARSSCGATTCSSPASRSTRA